MLVHWRYWPERQNQQDPQARPCPIVSMATFFPKYDLSTLLPISTISPATSWPAGN